MMHNPGSTSGSADTVTGALSVTGPQPVWMTLNEARSRAFTGEIVFEVDPEVRAYLDAGIVYFAERVTDSPLGRRLVEAGVVDTEQLERGTVRVGDVEHLGRMFDREPTIDRDAVLVVTETSTEELISDLANRSVTTVRATAYRHHPSGVHRWFVAQLGTEAAARAARPFEANLIEDLPGFNLLVDDELLIEWDDIDELTASTSPADADMFVFESPAAVSPAPVEEPTPQLPEPAAFESDLDVVEFDYDGGDVDEDDLAPEPADLDGVDLYGSDLDVADRVDREDVDEDFEFQVTWPDGSEESIEASVTTEIPVTSEPEMFTEAAETALPMPEPDLDEDEVASEVPDEVADAVRRAIAAIESVTVEPGAQPEDAPSSPVAESSMPAPQRFAPPTPDMRAEVIYAAQAAAGSEHNGTATGGGGGDERSSALRRLIGSLRRKDH